MRDDELLATDWAAALMDGATGAGSPSVARLGWALLMGYGLAVCVAREPMAFGGVVSAIPLAPWWVPVGVGRGLVFLALLWLVLSLGGAVPPSLSLSRRRDDGAWVARTLVAGLIKAGLLDENASPDDVGVEVVSASAPLEIALYLRRHGVDGERLEKAIRATAPDLYMLADSVVVEQVGPCEWSVRLDDVAPAERVSWVPVPWSLGYVREAGRDDAGLYIGRYADGAECLLDLRDNSALISGVQGSGKSVCVNAILAGLLAFPYEEVIVATTYAKALDFQAWEGLEGFTLHDGCVPFIEDLDWLRREMARRRDYLAREGVPNLKAVGFSRDFPHITVIVDEFAVLSSEQVQDEGEDGSPKVGRNGGPVMRQVGKEMVAKLADIAREGRAFGITVVVCLQRADSESIPTNLRALLTARVCFRQPAIESYEMGLGVSKAELPAPIPPSRLDGSPLSGVGYALDGRGVVRLFHGAFVGEGDDLRALVDELGGF